MYQKYIDQLRPKAIWNLQWYQEEDVYSEGEIEDKIIQLIAESSPEDYVKAIDENYGWSVYYHLTQVRKNILNWYPFEAESDVLEIGCGLGAITGILCDKCRTVTAVELSKKRALGALLRCRERENLEIIVGNLNDIEFSRKFDYITLIGVLEYQGRFTDTDNPYCDFLKKIKTLLKPQGKLLIAIENQYGLKYWCGAMEDHTGVPFDGMNQYLLTNQGIRTFSKAGMRKLIKESGFKNSFFYYPMPDYKLPTVIYSENYLPKNENMQNVEYYYAPDRNTLLADEKRLYADVIENGVFEFMANSFLVECSDSDKLGEIQFACLCNDRFPEYQLGTRIRKDGKVEKFALLQEKGTAHIRQTVANERSLSRRGLQTLGSCMENDRLVVDFVKASSLEEMFVEACKKGEKEHAFQLVDMLYKEIMKSSEEVSGEKNILYVLKPDLERNIEKYGPILKEGFLDMIFKNAFYIDKNWYWYDQEWMLENIPAKYILYRALGTTYYSFPDINEKISIQEIMEKFHLSDSQEEFGMLEQLFSSSIREQSTIRQSSILQGTDMERCVANIKKIMGT